MTTVAEIVTAIARLDPDQYLQLREELDRLDQQRWEAELQRTTEEMAKANVTDEDLDEIVLRRRRESRPS